MRLAWCLAVVLVAPAQELKLSSASAAAGQAVAVEITIQSQAGKEPVGLEWTLVLPKSPLKTTDEGPMLGDMGRQAGKSLTCVPKPSPESIERYACILVGGTQAIRNGAVALFIVSIPPKAPRGSYAVTVENARAVSAQGTGIALKADHSMIMVSDSHKRRK